MLKTPICIPLTIFSKSWKKFVGKFLAIQKVITQWSWAIDIMKYRHFGKFLMKNIGLLIFGLCTIILEREEGRAEKLAKKSRTIHQNWAALYTWNAYEINYIQSSTKWYINGIFKSTMLRASHIFVKVCFFQASKIHEKMTFQF